jgi:hypothetical protein
MKKILGSLFFLIICICSFGTAQIPDRLIYNGDTLALFDCPLGYYPDQGILSHKKMFGGKECFFTACWRNYVATWKIENDKLYLTEIRNACYPTDMKDVKVSYKAETDNIGNEYADLKLLFPDKFKDGKVAADWMNCNLLSPKGKLLHYFHDGFESIYEKEVEFKIENGLLLGIREMDNSKTKESVYSQDQKLLSNYIQTHIDYSNLPRSKDKIRVLVMILKTNEDGKIDSVRIIRGYNDVYNKEALRVVKSIPQWDVLFRHGEQINIYWTIPVIFQEEIK